MRKPQALALPNVQAGGKASLRELGRRLGEFGEPVGVMALSDRLAVQVLYAADMAGLIVPEQVAVLGV